MRGDAEGHDGLEADRRACAIAEGCKRRVTHFAQADILQSIVHPTIISRHFWPSLESSDIVMPGQFQAFVSISLWTEAKDLLTFK